MTDQAYTVHQQHPEHTGKDMFIVPYSVFADKHGQTKKTSLEPFLLDVLSLLKSLCHLQYIRYLWAYCDGKLSGTKYSFFSILRASISKILHFEQGVEMFNASTGKTCWVYGFLAILTGDSQERYKFVSVSSPSGKMPCYQCMSTKEDFSHGVVQAP